MYRIPLDLDLSSATGDFITQFGVGAHDIQFSLGNIEFAVYSEISLETASGKSVSWHSGWPPPELGELFNRNCTGAEVVDDRQISIGFEGGYRLILVDNSDMYESMIITLKGQSGQFII